MNKFPSHTIVRDVLDYFGKCPRCGYSAQAQTTVRVFADGTAEAETIAFCGMPCGWRGPVRTGDGADYLTVN